MCSLEEIIDKLREKPYLMGMGANKVAERIKGTAEDVRAAKKFLYRERFLHDVPINKQDSHSIPKILLLDIETAPLRAYVWRTWKQNIYLDQMISDWFMLTWAAKWLLEPEILSQRLGGKEVLEENDERIVETLWHLLNQADIVIAHNGKSFDIPKIKSRFLIHNLPPTTYYQQIDTKEIAAKEFGFSSNKLEGLARTFGIEGKNETDFTLWSSCMSGDEESLKYMEKYNRQDVIVLEEVYLIMRPYIKAHPNYNLFIDSEYPVCPNCGGKELEFAGYYYFTQTGKYRNYRCTSCGALARERKTVFKNSKTILVSNGK
jgi:DNA polymerase elongation subunit (family B)